MGTEDKCNWVNEEKLIELVIMKIRDSDDERELPLRDRAINKSYGVCLAKKREITEFMREAIATETNGQREERLQSLREVSNRAFSGSSHNGYYVVVFYNNTE